VSVARPSSLAVVLPPGEVHVWSAFLDLPAWRVQVLERGLSTDERRRADRFRYPRGRERFVAGRAFLRELLGRYLDLAPESIEFRYGPHGKPLLREGGAFGWLRFNLSHCEGRALCAVARERELGVDVERVRELRDAEAIVERFFSPRERAAWRELAPRDRDRGFFECWTRKEAFVKATGAGVGTRLEDFDVSLGPGEPARLLDVRGEHAVAARWWLADVATEPDHAAAVAVEGVPCRVVCGSWGEPWRRAG
jgi:4'-phosphopantetheinyl transferase